MKWLTRLNDYGKTVTSPDERLKESSTFLK